MAEVTDEGVDSPPLSDLSAQSSSENVARDIALLQPGKTDASELNPSKTEAAETIPQQQEQSRQQQSVLPPPPPQTKVVCGLESASDSHIGSAYMGGYLSESCTPEPTGLEYPKASYPPYQLPPNVAQLPYLPHHYGTYSHHWTHPNHPSLSTLSGPLPNMDHYNTTSYLPLTDQRHPLSSGVYSGPQHSVPSTIYTPSHQHTSSFSGPSPQPHPPPGVQPLPNPANPHTGHLPSFSDVPQADLLAKAFMTFLHSIGAVFRDPAFEPLLQSLDHHFDAKPQQVFTDHRESSESAPPPSPPISPQQRQQSPEKPREGVASTVTPLEGTVQFSVDSCDEDMEKEIVK